LILPNFLIIGAQKAASTWLMVRLQEHPDIYLPDWEIHFFSSHYHRGVEWYAKQFRPSGQSAIGEKSPLYLSSPEAPERIRAILGETVKLIASVRHPVDRAYSAYWHSVKDGRIAPGVGFLTAFREALPDLKENSEYWRHVGRYYECFSRDQLLVQVFEEVTNDPEIALRECVTFLELDENFGFSDAGASVNRAPREIRLLTRQAWAASRKLNRLPPTLRRPLKAMGRAVFQILPKVREHERLDPDLRRELTLVFKPGIERLEISLDRDLSLWYND
jgi:hypothetical protein